MPIIFTFLAMLAAVHHVAAAQDIFPAACHVEARPEIHPDDRVPAKNVALIHADGTKVSVRVADGMRMVAEVTAPGARDVTTGIVVDGLTSELVFKASDDVVSSLDDTYDGQSVVEFYPPYGAYPSPATGPSQALITVTDDPQACFRHVALASPLAPHAEAIASACLPVRLNGILQSKCDYAVTVYDEVGNAADHWTRALSLVLLDVGVSCTDNCSGGRVVTDSLTSALISWADVMADLSAVVSLKANQGQIARVTGIFVDPSTNEPITDIDIRLAFKAGDNFVMVNAGPPVSAVVRGECVLYVVIRFNDGATATKEVLLGVRTLAPNYMTLEEYAPQLTCEVTNKLLTEDEELEIYIGQYDDAVQYGVDSGSFRVFSCADPILESITLFSQSESPDWLGVDSIGIRVAYRGLKRIVDDWMESTGIRTELLCYDAQFKAVPLISRTSGPVGRQLDGDDPADAVFPIARGSVDMTDKSVRTTYSTGESVIVEPYDQPEPPGPSVAMIAGLAVAAFVLVVLIAGSAWWWKTKTNKNRSGENSPYGVGNLDAVVMT